MVEDEAPIVDWNAARKNIPGGHPGILELASMMREECARLMEEIREGLESGNAVRVKQAAHTLRGAALHFGAGAVVEATTAMQAYAAADALEPARAAWPHLETLIQRLDAELEQADVLAREDPEGRAP